MGVTDGTIHQRVRKLKKTGAIKRFTIDLNEEIMGNSSLAYVLVTVKPGYIERVSKEIIKNPQVLEVHEVHTRGDLLTKIRASSDDEIRDFIVNKLRTIEGIANSELIPVYKVWKEEANLTLSR
jgi:Lrp/AsnC family transcriptional regulator for asnA, asnC and gidA